MSSKTLPDAAVKRFGYVLKRAQHVLRLRIDEVLRPIGLTMPQYVLLTALEHENGISNAGLARMAFVTPQTMQAILVNLERDNMLVRQAHATHGRILQNELTPHGKKTLLRAHDAVNQVEALMMSSMNEAEARQVTDILTQCIDNLSVAEGRGKSRK